MKSRRRHCSWRPMPHPTSTARPSPWTAACPPLTPSSSAPHPELLGGIQRRAERSRDSLAESGFVTGEKVDAGGRDHFRLIDRDVADGKTLHHLSIAGDKARRPRLIIVR